MENTFHTFKNKYRCQNPESAFETLRQLFQDVGTVNTWIEKIRKIQVSVFDGSPNFNEIHPETILYSGQLYLKLIYACKQLRNFPPISKETLKWEYVVDDSVANRCLNSPHGWCYLHLIEFAPKYLSLDEILDPSGFMIEFFKRRKLKRWVKRWNPFREAATYSFSVRDGNEGEYLRDFHYLFKLTEAAYLIYARYSPNQKPKSHAFSTPL